MFLLNNSTVEGLYVYVFYVLPKEKEERLQDAYLEMTVLGNYKMGWFSWTIP